jgi:hypothetical protein
MEPLHKNISLWATTRAINIDKLPGLIIGGRGELYSDSRSVNFQDSTVEK